MAELILYNGQFPTIPKATAVAVIDGEIAYIGNDSMAQSFSKPQSQKINLNGGFVFPGFCESHAHLIGTGLLKSRLNFAGKNFDQTCDLLKEKAKTSISGQWIYGRGWDQNLWGSQDLPTNEILNQIFPNNPVYLTRVDGHAAWVNDRALALAGIDRSTTAPPGGAILKNPKGQPTGVLIDTAMDLVSKLIPKPSDDEIISAVNQASKQISSMGITSFHDAGSDRQTLSVFKNLAETEKLPFYLYAMYKGETLQDYKAFVDQPVFHTKNISLRSIKVFIDGALGSRGAALFEPYCDDCKNRGIVITDAVELEELSRSAIKTGYQVCTHAIGDRANHIALNAFEKAGAQNKRFRIEHAQILLPDDIPRFAKTRTIASMQPIHCTCDMPWAEARLGNDRLANGAYAWQSLLKAGAVVASGSDSPVEDLSPLKGFYAAVTRQTPEGLPPEGWYPHERMSRIEALKSYTWAGAYASFTENETGSLAVGKRADLCVLSENILVCPPEKILEARVQMTCYKGQITYVSA